MRPHRHQLVDELCAAADRFADLADVAELMGDDSGALRLRQQAASRRAEAMSLLDDGE